MRAGVEVMGQRGWLYVYDRIRVEEFTRLAVMGAMGKSFASKLLAVQYEGVCTHDIRPAGRRQRRQARTPTRPTPERRARSPPSAA